MWRARSSTKLRSPVEVLLRTTTAMSFSGLNMANALYPPRRAVVPIHPGLVDEHPVEPDVHAAARVSVRHVRGGEGRGESLPLRSRADRAWQFVGVQLRLEIGEHIGQEADAEIAVPERRLLQTSDAAARNVGQRHTAAKTAPA